MYHLAREGKIDRFTGISDPYEEPVNPELTVETDVLTIEASARKVMTYLKDRELIPKMVPRGRIELPTPAFSGQRSTTELPRH